MLVRNLTPTLVNGSRGVIVDFLVVDTIKNEDEYRFMVDVAAGNRYCVRVASHCQVTHANNMRCWSCGYAQVACTPTERTPYQRHVHSGGAIRVWSDDASVSGRVRCHGWIR
jgi:hypothetical protein